MKKFNLIIFLLGLFVSNIQGQSISKPEKQISFAREKKTHSYYVRQGELWWNEVEKDIKSESNWFNYYRACRNAQGTNDWKDDFLKESKTMRLGSDIVKLMAEHIPNTFTYYYVSGSTGGVDPSSGKDLLKAYEMNPDFDGIDSDVVTLAQSNSDTLLRQKANKKWFSKNNFSIGLLNYAYNVLMSVEKNGILLTEHDNDSYPIWMLQDAKGIRKDVTVINIDFLILDSYREKIFKELNLIPINLQTHDITNYGLNWETIVNHILQNFNKGRPLYLAQTLNPTLYKNFSTQLFISGLTLKHSKKPINLTKKNIEIIEDLFLLDYIKVGFTDDISQNSVNFQNLNYLKPFKIVYEDYKTNKQFDKAKNIKNYTLFIADNQTDDNTAKEIKEKFK